MDQLRQFVQTLGKPAWRPMLEYVVALHERCVNPARDPFPYPWEEIGPGYCNGPAFGHIDLTHAVLDVLPAEPEHARQQLLNNLAAQQDDGLVPGVIRMDGERPQWKDFKGYPPVWVMGVEACYEAERDDEFLAYCLDALVRQIGWFDAKRRSDDGRGYFYLDVHGKPWESGVDEGIRFVESPEGQPLCIDATAHGYMMHDHAARWAQRLGRPSEDLAQRAAELRQIIQDELFDPEVGFFFDSWAMQDRSVRHITFEGLAPLIAGAASHEQANRVIDGYVLSPEHFFAEHPITTVSRSDPQFELRMWRGPAWNSITMWCARACLHYGRHDAAAAILEPALDDSARHFASTGTVWEFYHPFGGDPSTVERKPDTPNNAPCGEYLGHNPLCAMANLFDQATSAAAGATNHAEAGVNRSGKR